MRLIDPSQRIKVLWDNDDGTRYTEEMTIRRLLAVMSDDEVKTITITCCEECVCHNECRYEQYLGLKGFCSKGERRTNDV